MTGKQEQPEKPDIRTNLKQAVDSAIDGDDASVKQALRNVIIDKVKQIVTNWQTNK